MNIFISTCIVTTLSRDGLTYSTNTTNATGQQSAHSSAGFRPGQPLAYAPPTSRTSTNANLSASALPSAKASRSASDLPLAVWAKNSRLTILGASNLDEGKSPEVRRLYRKIALERVKRLYERKKEEYERYREGFVPRFRGDRPREPPDPPPLTVSLLITAKRVQKPPLVSKNPGFDEEKKFIRSLFEPKWKVIFEIVDIDGQNEDVCKPCDLGQGKEGFEKKSAQDTYWNSRRISPSKFETSWTVPCKAHGHKGLELDAMSSMRTGSIIEPCGFSLKNTDVLHILGGSAFYPHEKAKERSGLANSELIKEWVKKPPERSKGRLLFGQGAGMTSWLLI